jgi:hypothetical protein
MQVPQAPCSCNPAYANELGRTAEDPCGHGDTSEGCVKHDPELRRIFDEAHARIEQAYLDQDSPEYVPGGWFAQETDRVIADTNATLAELLELVQG